MLDMRRATGTWRTEEEEFKRIVHASLSPMCTSCRPRFQGCLDDVLFAAVEGFSSLLAPASPSSQQISIWNERTKETGPQ